MQIEGRVGPQALSVGAQQPPRLGNSAEVVTQDGNGRYYEPNYRGFLYTATTAAAGVTIAATNVSPLTANTGVPLVGVFNPVASTVNLVILRAKVATVSGTPGGPFVWNVIPNPAGISAAGTQGRNNKTFASGGTAQAFVNTAITGSLVGIMFRSLGGPAAIAAGAGLYTVDEETAGDIIVAPGGFCGIAATAAGTTHVVTASMTWAEIPV
jgi:hypothetical protein